SGKYSLGLYPGYNLLFDYQPFSLVQTGDIGANIQSVRFINYGSPFELRVNGTPISLTYEYQPGNTDPDTRLAVVTGDLSAFAGQTVQLKFTTLDMAGSVVNGQLHGLTCKRGRSEEHTSELQSRGHLVCRLLLEKKKIT